MNPIDRLIKIFSEFPGIGPKQARRFAYFLVTRSDGYIADLKRGLDELRAGVAVCPECRRYFAKSGAAKRCAVCADEHRDARLLMVVSRDIDLDNIEKSRAFAGRYFVLGGTVPILDKHPEERIRLAELLKRVAAAPDLSEIVLGLDANAEGEYTGEIVKAALAPVVAERGIRISELGRGLSSGAELEYSDPDTITSAFKNRS